MSYDRIPDELKTYKAWVGFKIEEVDGRLTKPPYMLCTQRKASSTNPDTWDTFACAVEQAHNYSGIGFVFSTGDPYTFIDLDHPYKTNDDGTFRYADPDMEAKRIEMLIAAFDSYTEISPSGKGAHIIVKGSIPRGIRKGCVEMYSTERFATMTGNIWLHHNEIRNRQEELDEMFDDMTSGPKNGGNVMPPDQPQVYSDEIVINRGKSARNGFKFTPLWEGDWRKDYLAKANLQGTASSEADCAFMNMLYLYTKNHAQLKRVFLSSGLCRPKYTGRNGEYYLNSLIAKAADGNLDYDVSMIDWSAFALPAPEQQTAPEADGDTPEAASIQTGMEIPVALVQRDESRDDLMDRIARDFKYEPPHGLLGEITEYILSQAPRPVKEIALGGAISLMAGICGQAYNVSATGLNQYVLILAGTGTGKEAANSGINKLIHAVGMKVPTALEFLGPSQIASQQALIAYLDKNPCFLSVIGEFGLQLQQMTGRDAKDHQMGLRKVMLSLYNMSGIGDKFQPMIYADPAKNTKILSAPNFSMLGESTPERFYEALSEDMIYEGFLPRFSIIEYKGERPYPNREHHLAVPSEKLINDLASLCAGVKAAMASRAVTNVQFANDALQTFYDFGAYGDDKQRGEATEFTKSLWSRTDIKAMKMAALIAVGRHYQNPVITLDMAEWAIGMALNDIRSLELKFLDGEIGRSNMSTDEQKQVDAIIRAVSQWRHNPFDTYSKYGGTQSMHDADMVVAENVQRRIVSQTYFQKDRIGPTNALNRAFKTLCEWGYLEEVLDKKKLKDSYGHTKRTFALIDKDKFPVSLSKPGTPGR